MIEVTATMPATWTVVLLWLLAVLTCGHCLTINKTLSDNTPANRFVMNIVNEAGLAAVVTLNPGVFTFLEVSKYTYYFSLGNTTGDLRTVAPLDRDEVCPSMALCNFVLSVAFQSFDKKVYQAIRISMTIMDENDNGPVFNSRNITIPLSETIAVGPVADLDPATDVDSLSNGIQDYQLVDPTGMFQLKEDRISGAFQLTLILKKPLDREICDMYRLQLIAFDGGVPPRSAYQDIYIQVMDVNDNSPLFNVLTYDVSVPEDAPVGTIIVLIEATDTDMGFNGDILYSFDDSASPYILNTLSLNASTGEISIRQPLDYETSALLSFTIIAEDKGSNPLPATAKVLITVLDVNDHTPEIIFNGAGDPPVFNISENIPINTFIVHISVRDSDSGPDGNVTCHLNTVNFNLIRLVDKEYKVTTAAVLDREVYQYLNFTIICCDDGQPSLSSYKMAHVNVLDVNDNPPIFNRTKYTAFIEENNPVGSYVLTVSATDRDEGLNRQINYGFVGLTNPYFDIQEHMGVVTTKVVFDYEVQSIYDVILVTFDSGVPSLSSTVSLIVDIGDMDDHTAQFNQSTYQMDIYEDMPPFTIVGTVRAIDEDSNPMYNQVQYTLEPSSSHYFSINRDNGTIYCNMSLDREVQDMYMVYVVATGKTLATRVSSATATVIINVLDVNDNEPVITFPTGDMTNIALSTRTPLNYVVCRVVAYDLDEGDNNKLQYQLIATTSSEHILAIDTQGVITVVTDLNNYQNQNFQVGLVVSDSGVPPQSMVISLNITIDNSAPVISPGSSNGVPTPYKSQQGVSMDTIAIIVGIICGLAIIILVIVLVVLMLSRRRKQSRNRHMVKTWTQNGSSKNFTSIPDYSGPIVANTMEEDMNKNEQIHLLTFERRKHTDRPLKATAVSIPVPQWPREGH